MKFRVTTLFIVLYSSLGFARQAIPFSPNFVLQVPLQDTVPATDTIKPAAGKSVLEDPVISNAEDSITYSIDGQTAYLYGNAVVTYAKQGKEQGEQAQHLGKYQQGYRRKA